MTENGEELERPDASDWSNEEIKDLLLRSGTVERPSMQMVVGLGFAGLASKETEPREAHVLLDFAEGYLQKSLELGSKDRMPHQPTVLSRMFLNLWPLLTDVIAYKRMSEPDDVRKYYRRFISSVESQYTQVRSFMGKGYSDPKRNAQQWDLLTAFESVAGVGLLMRRQIKDGTTGSELALPAVLHTESVRTNPKYPFQSYWNIDMYGSNEHGNVSRRRGVYLRLREAPLDCPVTDPSASVVWFGTDLALASDRANSKRSGTFVSPLVVVDELIKEHRHAENLDSRSMHFTRALGQRTVSSLVEKPE